MVLSRERGIDFSPFFCYNKYIMIWEAIKVQAKSNGGKTALICHDKKYTYSELVDSVEKLSATISTAIKPGERVLFASKKNIIT